MGLVGSRAVACILVLEELARGGKQHVSGYSDTSGYRGGRTETSAEKCALLPIDFGPTTSQDLDEFLAPTDENVEERSKTAIFWDDWLRRAREAAVIFQ